MARKCWLGLLDYDGTAGAENTTATNWGVVNDGSGNLGGYAWGENIGWIKFDHTQTSNVPTTTWSPTVASTATVSAGGNAIQVFVPVKMATKAELIAKIKIKLIDLIRQLIIILQKELTISN